VRFLERVAYKTEWQIAALLVELALVGAALLAAARRLSRTT
jgi:hypothetical protein